MVTEIQVKVTRANIAFLNKIIEGYDNLGVVSTLHAHDGLALIRVTPDTEETVRNILRNLSCVEML